MKTKTFDYNEINISQRASERLRSDVLEYNIKQYWPKRIKFILKNGNFKYSSKDGRQMFYSVNFLVTLVSFGQDHNKCSVCSNYTHNKIKCPYNFNREVTYLQNPISLLYDTVSHIVIPMKSFNYTTLFIERKEYLMCNFFVGGISDCILISKVKPKYEFINHECYKCGYYPRHETMMIPINNRSETVCAACHIFALEILENIFIKYMYSKSFIRPNELAKKIIDLFLKDEFYDNFKCFIFNFDHLF